MKNILFFVFILTLATNLSGQNPLVKQWDYRYGGNSDDRIQALIETNDGGYLLGGSTISLLSGDITENSRGAEDYWVIKIDANGFKQWDKRFGGSNNDDLMSMKQTSDNGYILAGYSASDSSSDKSQNGCGSGDYWIIKIDSIGNKLWDKTYGGNQFEFLWSVQLAPNGGYILAGLSYSGISGDRTQPNWGISDYWIVRTDSLGNKIWDKRFGGSGSDNLYDMCKSTKNTLIIGGESNSQNGDKSQPTCIINSGDYWIVEVDTAGDKIWDKDFGGDKMDQLRSIIPTFDGGYVLCGISNSNISCDKTQPPWDLFCNPYCHADYWLVKIDSTGNKQWDKTYGGLLDEDPAHVNATLDGGYIISGDSYSGIGGDKSQANLSTVQTWFVKIDSLGNIQWDRTLLTLSNYGDIDGYAIQTKDGGYLAVNSSSSGIGGDKTQPNWNGVDFTRDFWVIKFYDSTSTFAPSINLSSSDTSFCEKQCIDFTDLSTNNPTSWQWLFNGGTPDTSTMQNPTNICYNSYGNFDVTLIACNAAGCDTLTFYNFIHEFPNPVDSIWTDSINFQLISAPANSYQWYEVGSGLIAGETNQILIPPHAGNFYCVITDANGCIGTSNVIYTTAVESTIYDLGFTISPNPFTSNIAIDFQKQSRSFGIKEAIITIRDMIGRIVFQSEITNPKSEIPLSFLQSGMYMIEVIVDGKRIVKKIVKAP